ncbi:hypothetical protein K439DRAFT_1616562 [Ramaria rubella]|nr:hypothetical protein K439DRAFT_1616562 [Ramaria rubella]
MVYGKYYTEDGIVFNKRWQCSNILKVDSSLRQQNFITKQGLDQITLIQKWRLTLWMLYGAMGLVNNLFRAETIGVSLADKVEESYAFIANNDQPGDEIFLWGLYGSHDGRINCIKIPVAYRVRVILLRTLHEPTVQARGIVRAEAEKDAFTIKYLGVFDTVDKPVEKKGGKNVATKKTVRGTRKDQILKQVVFRPSSVRFTLTLVVDMNRTIWLTLP